MRRAARAGLTGVAGVGLALATAATTRAFELTGDTISVTANGNAFGGLSFAPANVDARLGDRIVWTDTDAIAPHTVTEDHGLFDLVGNDVDGTPVSPPGFGPGTSVDLLAFAGTTSYHCRVHPGKMSGVIRVPVHTVLGPPYKAPRTPARTKAGKARRAERKRSFQRRLTLSWAVAEPADGQAFDVQVRRGSGPWKPLLTRTLDTTITIDSGKKGTTSRVRARLRLASDEAQATGWSPETIVTP